MGRIVFSDLAAHWWRPMSDADDVLVSVKAAQVTADMFKEPAVIMFDLSVKRESELKRNEHYLEKVRPNPCWQVN
jgi:hypothetical protein